MNALHVQCGKVDECGRFKCQITSFCHEGQAEQDAFADGYILLETQAEVLYRDVRQNQSQDAGKGRFIYKQSMSRAR